MICGYGALLLSLASCNVAVVVLRLIVESSLRVLFFFVVLSDVKSNVREICSIENFCIVYHRVKSGASISARETARKV